MKKLVTNPVRFALLVLLLGNGLRWSATAEPQASAADLQPLRHLFDHHLDASLEQEKTQESSLLDRHEQGLIDLRASAQQRGDLDAWQRMDAALRAFRLDRRPIPPESGDDTGPLANLFRQTEAAIDQAELAHAQRRIQLARQYQQALEERMRQHVREGRIDAAALFRDEIEQLAQHPNLRAAEFVVAEHTTERRVRTEPDPPEPEPVEPEPVEPEPEDPVHDPYRRTQGTFQPGWTAPADTRRDGFRPNPLFPTGKGRIDTSLIIEGFLAGGSDPVLRLRIRPRRQDQTFRDLTVMVQFFHRGIADGGQWSGRERTRPGGVSFVRIDRLEAVGATCEFPPPDSLRRAPLYAYLVSVFDAQGSLLFQVCSNHHIKDMGRSQRPNWLASP